MQVLLEEAVALARSQCRALPSQHAATVGMLGASRFWVFKRVYFI
jgi:hypothetical protein